MTSTPKPSRSSKKRTVYKFHRIRPYGYVTSTESGLVISWVIKRFGFGEVRFHFCDDGTVKVDTEYMSKEFVKALLQTTMKKLLQAERIG